MSGVVWQALGEAWGAVSHPIDTITAAATNVWNGITWNIGYLTGTDSTRAQVSQEIETMKQDEQKYYDTHPGSTATDYTNYLTSTFPDRFTKYVGQPNTGSANNGLSNMPEAMKLGMVAIGIMFIISLFRN